MFGRNGIEQTVEKIVGKVLDSHVGELRQELVRRVLEEVKPAKGAEAASGPGADELLTSVEAIYGATTQRDILKTLLDQVAVYCGRAALFVVKAGAATGWQARGIGDAIKDFPLNASCELVSEALQSHRAAWGNGSKMDKEFISEFGGPASGDAGVLPLMLKEKVAALVYADAGTEKHGRVNSPAIELLVLITGTWLEVASVRKPATANQEASAEAPAARAAAASAGPSFSDPFASHTPAFSSAAAAAPAIEVESPAAAATPQTAGMSSEDADVHRKAQRFARLLVDEIKLYNQPKLMEGRKNKDLYDRLKEDIDKSRSTYQKRYGSTAAGPADYFSQELIRSLAEDDVSLLGSNFPR